MSFQEDKNKLIEYIRQCTDSSNDEQKLEEFFEFIDELEYKVREETQYYTLVADAYMAVGDTQKAKESFLKIYNSNNKKDIKKLMNYDMVKAKPIVRPSRRPKIFPEFKYADKAVLTNKFIMSGDCACSICKRESVPLYIGMAYMSSKSEINFLNQSDKFCV